jgi:hypothetical protein
MAPKSRLDRGLNLKTTYMDNNDLDEQELGHRFDNPRNTSTIHEEDQSQSQIIQDPPSFMAAGTRSNINKSMEFY